MAKASAKRASRDGSRSSSGGASAQGGKTRAPSQWGGGAKAKPHRRQTSRLALSWAQERRRRAEAKSKGAAEPKPGSRLRVAVLGVSLLTSVFTASAWLGGLVGPAFAGVEDMTRTALVDAGFTLAHVEVRGVRHAEAGEVAAALGLEPGALIFDFDPVAAKARVEQLPWVDEAVVLRLLPDRVVVMVDERSPLAVWGGPDGAVVLDAEGAAIPSADPASLDSLPRLEGEAAPEAAAALIQALARHPSLARRVDGFERVGGRRWDVTLKSGLLIRLPEGEPAAALDRLAALEARENLFEMPLEVIDLRGDDLVLRPRALPAAGPQRGA